MRAKSAIKLLNRKIRKTSMVLMAAVLVSMSGGLYARNVFAGGDGDPCADGIPDAYYSVYPTKKGVGTLEASFDGSYSYACNTPIVSYVWDFGDGATVSGATVSHQFGVGTFSPSLTITDEEGLTNTASLHEIIVKSDNQNPVFNDITETAFHQNPVRINVKDYASDPDGDDLGNNYSLEGVENSYGSLVTEKGSAYLNPSSGILEYRARDYNPIGQDVLTLTVNDGFGGVDSATVTINLENYVTGIDDYVETYEGEPITIDVLANDHSYYGEPVAIGLYAYENKNGESTVNADGTVTFYPTAGFTGTGSFQYVIYSSDPDRNAVNHAYAYISVVERPNQSPVAENDNLSLDEDASGSVNVLANDQDEDGDSITAAIVTAPEHGSGILEADGTLNYTPAANYYGSDKVTYELTDSEGNTSTGAVTITVHPVNDIPIVNDDNTTVDEDNSAVVAVLGNDIDVEDGSGMAVSVISAPQNGTTTINDNGTISYVPNANYNGNDSFEYRVTDSNGATADATVTVRVGSVNDAPSAAFSYSMNKGGNAFFDAGASTDIDGRIVSYRWDFGDGSSATSTTSSITHKYKVKSALVTLVVTDDIGTETTYTATVSR